MGIIVKSFFTLLSKVLPYGLFQCLACYRNLMYTYWIRQFVGSFGDNSIVEAPCRLSGGGRHFISIGNNVHIQSHCILGCWVEYGN